MHKLSDLFDTRFPPQVFLEVLKVNVCMHAGEIQADWNLFWTDMSVSEERCMRMK
jgi:hypothetical protein